MVIIFVSRNFAFALFLGRMPLILMRVLTVQKSPIPQRFNSIDLSLVSQLSVRILVFLFPGSKPLLWHINPFSYSYSILWFCYDLSILSSTHTPSISSSTCSITFFTVVLTLICQKTVFSSLSHRQIYHCLEIFTGHTSVSDWII